ncbi:MAG: CPBP family intramembrane metalloprotease, partial [Acidobacteriaceae bacterium]|nr:CPBP family intramembrane metalloprotease [Acidobacteriaceae bacterium]
MWVRVGVLAVLSLRRIDNVRFGFLPTSQEWRIGIEQFLYFLPLGAILAYFLHFAHFHPVAVVWWKFALFLPLLFCGILWGLALGEEFFFRGFLQQLLSKGLHSDTAGLLAASAIFGSAHLPFRAFPNWRFAVLAGIAGVFYGLAFLKARSIRASMVTHALIVTVWRSLFSA